MTYEISSVYQTDAHGGGYVVSLGDSGYRKFVPTNDRIAPQVGDEITLVEDERGKVIEMYIKVKIQC
jgi:hypothetical protein